MLEAKRLEYQGKTGVMQIQDVLDPGAQTVGGQFAGIHQMAVGGYLFQHFTFGAYAFFERTITRGEGMSPSRFREALDQRLILGGQEKDAQIHALAQTVKIVRQTRQAGATARINADCDFAYARQTQIFDGLGE